MFDPFQRLCALTDPVRQEFRLLDFCEVAAKCRQPWRPAHRIAKAQLLE
jgi:hypothetical protein